MKDNPTKTPQLFIFYGFPSKIRETTDNFSSLTPTVHKPGLWGPNLRPISSEVTYNNCLLNLWNRLWFPGHFPSSKPQCLFCLNPLNEWGILEEHLRFKVQWNQRGTFWVTNLLTSETGSEHFSNKLNWFQATPPNAHIIQLPSPNTPLFHNLQSPKSLVLSHFQPRKIRTTRDLTPFQ